MKPNDENTSSDKSNTKQISKFFIRGKEVKKITAKDGIIYEKLT